MLSFTLSGNNSWTTTNKESSHFTHLHIRITFHILMSYSILVIYTCLYMFHKYNLHMLMQSYTFLSYHVSFQVVYIFLLVLVNIYLSLFTYHHIAMLCFSYHVMYFLSFSNHLHILVISFMFHACINLRSG